MKYHNGRTTICLMSSSAAIAELATNIPHHGAIMRHVSGNYPLCFILRSWRIREFGEPDTSLLLSSAG
jgi:hypothetical protein